MVNMSTFPRLTEDNDWMIGNIATGDEGILFDVKTAVQEWQKDCWFNMNSGADYYATLRNGQMDKLLKQQINSIIQKRDGVMQVIDVTTKLENRALKIAISFKTIYGTELSFTTQNGG